MLDIRSTDKTVDLLSSVWFCVALWGALTPDLESLLSAPRRRDWLQFLSWEIRRETFLTASFQGRVTQGKPLSGCVFRGVPRIQKAVAGSQFYSASDFRWSKDNPARAPSRVETLGEILKMPKLELVPKFRET